MTIDAPPPKKNGSTAVVGSEDPFNLWGNFHPSICLIKLQKVGRPANRFFLMIPWYIVPFFHGNLAGPPVFWPPPKTLTFGKGYIALKKHRFPKVFLKIQKSVGWTFVPNEFADLCISVFTISSRDSPSKFTFCLLPHPVTRGTLSSSTPSQAGCEKVVFGEWKHTFLKPETSIYIQMVLSIG